MTRHRSSAWRAMSPQQRLEALMAHAATGAQWAEFEEIYGMAVRSVLKAVAVLGITNRSEPPRVRAAIPSYAGQSDEEEGNS